MRWPWQSLLRRAAIAQGFMDPTGLLKKLRQFGQPSEVEYPIELLRAGVMMHARGLINARVIQHNLDWRWPYWVRRQYDPHDVSFVPRAFALTHINLTHRNWTACGVPDVDAFAIVDPAGLVTPYWDGWSIDVWLRDAHGQWLIPAYADDVVQTLELAPAPAVVTRTRLGRELALEVRAEGIVVDGAPRFRVSCEAEGPAAAWLVVALRPFNPEGVSFITDVRLEGRRWIVNGQDGLELNVRPDLHLVSRYAEGDIYTTWDERRGEHAAVSCAQGMATAAAGFRLDGAHARSIRVEGPLRTPVGTPAAPPLDWPRALEGACALDVPDPRFAFLFEAAQRTLVLLSPEEVYPGPYTYRRFWYRDAAFLIDALLALGLTARAARALARFPARQTLQGYFCSQDGEWDSNGEAIWILARYAALTGRTPDRDTLGAVRRGAQWIVRKRAPDGDAPHAGLLPAGFSAEHLGPNDYYYWDDFWGVAGLRAAATLLETGDPAGAARCTRDADAFAAALDRSLATSAARLGRPAMPASPYRRLDGGAVGSLAAGYPLASFGPRDPRLLDTAEFLHQHCLVGGGFFQDIIHSGINPYLTLHLAQVWLRAGDARHAELAATVMNLASPTGQWPEAVHPRNGGGCMGDGQHGWAAAEWVLYVRNCFVREEDDRLVLGSGLPAVWLGGRPLGFGPTLTRFGAITVGISGPADAPHVTWEADWRGTPPAIHCALPGCEQVIAAADCTGITLRRRAACAS
ncbi:MAG: hypothetical protein HY943_23100 [Gammaproteobacteria bacterium]|nr:hypothetical protein [Gammaproteobacteria bacterium]